MAHEPAPKPPDTCPHCGRRPGEGGCDWIECPGHSPRSPTLKHVRMIDPSGQVSNISGTEAEAIWGGALDRPGLVVMRHEGDTRIIKDQHGQTFLTPVFENARPCMSAPWTEVSRIERQIRMLAYTSAGDPARQDDMKMFSIWSGVLQKAISDANS